MTETQSKAVSARYPVGCPRCGAAEGKPCRSLGSGRVTDTHKARREAAYSAPKVVQPDWTQPQIVSELDLAFPARGLEISPAWEEIPDEFRSDASGWCRFANRWFMNGLPGDGAVQLKDGIDGEAAFRHLKVVLGCFGSQHQHKIASVGYLSSLWFEWAQIGETRYP